MFQRVSSRLPSRACNRFMASMSRLSVSLSDLFFRLICSITMSTNSLPTSWNRPAKKAWLCSTPQSRRRASQAVP